MLLLILVFLMFAPLILDIMIAKGIIKTIKKYKKKPIK